ncbi:membrane protein [Kitasatospora herbaricolor]|uniref:MMPL family transporter n=1 Tax=Kitasatospora herbaricolor TaxID=68217 RepID=UPI00174822B2|nr:MMPL family transporter [Kitasatospora herbaricolor]MDQ0313281.1 RND superfamily putative drug exporter [Kitasatospora herbaricolor]GGV20045.1 membrane protein [Kitasatospora herbaricolor]
MQRASTGAEPTGTEPTGTGTPHSPAPLPEPPRSPTPGRPGLLHRTGHWCARHAWRVLAVWALLLAGLAVADRAWGGDYADSFSLPGTGAQTGADLLRAHSSGAAGVSAPIVISAGTGSLAGHRDAVEAAVGGLGRLPDVLSVTDPLGTPGALSASGSTGIVTVHFGADPAGYGDAYLARLDSAVRPLRADHLTVEYGAPLGQLTAPKAADRASEAIGLAVAVLVLLVGFGSVAATGLPLLTAVAGLAAGLGGLGLLAARVDFARSAPTLAAMMGLGVGIDYALFLTTRYRALLRDVPEPAEAVGRTVATSGRAVLVAAATVAMALAGLYAGGVSFIGTLGAAAGLTVLVGAAASLTLTPALLGLLGDRIDRLRVRTPVAEPVGDPDVWHRWAGALGRRPWLYLVGGLLVLGVLAVPVASMRLSHVDAGAQPTSRTDRRAYDLIGENFGPGANGPLTVVVQLDSALVADRARREALASSLRQELAALPGVAAVSPPTSGPDDVLLIATVTPGTGPQDERTADLFHTLRDTGLPHALAGTGAVGYVTGGTATGLTFTDTLVSRLPLVVGVVVAAAFLLLLTVFRSVLIAVKAALLNLFSIAAAHGVVVAVFQWGWGSSLLGVTARVPVESYVPMMMFAIVFGLSMDYEVFLLSRIRETWLRTGDNHLAVATGLAATARVITCAAVIMTSVFLAFLLSTGVVVKMLALGLGVSVIIDATVVRLLLVPASMYLFRRANWWLPRRLDALLPHFDPEGPAVPAARGEQR